MRLLAPSLIVLTLLSAILDLWCLPETWPLAWNIRAAVGVVLGVSTLVAYRFEDIYRIYYQPIQAASILVTSIGLISIIAQSNTGEPGHSAYLAGIMLLIVMTADAIGDCAPMGSGGHV